MASRYIVVQCVPDVVADERINIGVVAADGAVVRSAFLGSWERVRRFVGSDISYLQRFAEAVGSAHDRPLTLQGLGENTALDEPALLEMAKDWHYSIQFTAPRASTLSPVVFIERMSGRFLKGTPRMLSGYRDRKAAGSLVIRAVRGVLEARLGNGVRPFLRTKASIRGELDHHRFDIAVGNGRALMAAQGMSFEIPDSGRLVRSYAQAAWAADDIRKRSPTMRLGIMALPPRPGMVGYSEATESFARADQVLGALGAPLIPESQFEQWVTDAASSVDLWTMAHKADT